MIGPIGFHPVCFERVFFTVGDSCGTGGEEETPSIAKISSDKPLDIGMGTAPPEIGFREVTSERSFMG